MKSTEPSLYLRDFYLANKGLHSLRKCQNHKKKIWDQIILVVRTLATFKIVDMNIVGYIPGATMKYFGEQFLIFEKTMETKKININWKIHVYLLMGFITREDQTPILQGFMQCVISYKPISWCLFNEYNFFLQKGLC